MAEGIYLSPTSIYRLSDGLFGIGGLLAARVCHDHFDTIVIVEPEVWVNSEDAMYVDTWNQKSKHSRIMQYKSLHSFQPWATRLCTSFSLILRGNITRRASSKFWYHPFCFVVNLCRVSTSQPMFACGEMRPPYTEYDGGTLPEAFDVSRSAHNPGYPDRTLVRTPEVSKTSLLLSIVQARCNSKSGYGIPLQGPAAAGLKWHRREGYGFADIYEKPATPGLVEDCIQPKASCSTLQSHVVPKLGRKHSGLPLPYDECGYIYIAFLRTQTKTIKTYTLSVLMVTSLYFSTMGEYQLPNTLEESKAFSRSLIIEKPTPEIFFSTLDMLDDVTDIMTYSWIQLHQIREGHQPAL
ncbi:hypothetical protein DFS33DRAFT_892713 [Desarmillaria ectypa]|nr:hypothetical protein DFS33DRAFT_892713 [Desarmillaria ectypa]